MSRHIAVFVLKWARLWDRLSDNLNRALTMDLEKTDLMIVHRVVCLNCLFLMLRNCPQSLVFDSVQSGYR
jgi:hypothetical protein